MLINDQNGSLDRPYMFVISLDDIEHTSYNNVINLGSKLWDAQWEQII